MCRSKPGGCASSCQSAAGQVQCGGRDRWGRREQTTGEQVADAPLAATSSLRGDWVRRSARWRNADFPRAPAVARVGRALAGQRKKRRVATVHLLPRTRRRADRRERERFATPATTARAGADLAAIGRVVPAPRWRSAALPASATAFFPRKQTSAAYAA